MNTYFFKIEVEPLPGNQQGERVAGADAHVWVLAESMDDAEQKAFAVISGYGWAPISVQDKRLMPPERLAGLDTPAQSHARKAQANGSSAYFVAWAKQGHQADERHVPLLKPHRKLLH